MVTSGPLSPASGVSQGGGTAWTSPGSILSSNNVYATLTASTPQQLYASSYGFAIPAGSTILGITAEVERKRGTGGSATDSVIQLSKDGSVVGSNLSTGATWPTSDAYATFGGAANLWGTTWTAEEINASGFGLILKPSSSVVTASVDYIRITVTYEEVVGGFTTIIDTSMAA